MHDWNYCNKLITCFPRKYIKRIIRREKNHGEREKARETEKKSKKRDIGTRKKTSWYNTWVQCHMVLFAKLNGKENAADTNIVARYDHSSIRKREQKTSSKKRAKERKSRWNRHVENILLRGARSTAIYCIWTAPNITLIRLPKHTNR